MVLIKTNENISEKMPSSEAVKARHFFDEKDGKFYFSIVDVIEEVAESSDAQNYWKVLKNRLKKAQNQLVTKCNQLKMKAKDGKYYLTDTADKETIEGILKYVPKTNWGRFGQLVKSIEWGNSLVPLETPTSLNQEENSGNEAKLLVDAYETKTSITIIAMIAGVDPEKLIIYLENKKIIISGKREKENYSENKSKNYAGWYAYEELQWVSFFREIVLPCPIDKEKIKTSTPNGMLKIELAKFLN